MQISNTKRMQSRGFIWRQHFLKAVKKFSVPFYRTKLHSKICDLTALNRKIVLKNKELLKGVFYTTFHQEKFHLPLGIEFVLAFAICDYNEISKVCEIPKATNVCGSQTSQTKGRVTSILCVPMARKKDLMSCWRDWGAKKSLVSGCAAFVQELMVSRR